MEKLLVASNLEKSYGRKVALDGLNMEMDRGKIYGILGPNGSGKTTFLNIITGFTRKSYGYVRINGIEPCTETKKFISYLPDRSFLYKWMRIKDAVNLFRDFYPGFDVKKMSELLDFMKLKEDMKVADLSRGMAEKLHLSLVLSRKADLYILDEPIAAVDPVAREKILDAIINNYSEDGSMLITTHLVKDIERIFDEVAFISEGKIVNQGNAESLRLQYGKSIDEIYREIFAE